MKQNLILNHKVTFKPNSSFSQRESTINTEILKIQESLRSRGFYPISQKVVTKTDKNATIEIIYQP